MASAAAIFTFSACHSVCSGQGSTNTSIVARSVVRAELATFVGIQAAFRQRAEDRGVDLRISWVSVIRWCGR